MITIQPSSIVDTSAQLGDGVSIGEFCHIRANCTIGSNTKFGGNCTLSAGSVVGSNCIIKYGFVMTDTGDLSKPTIKTPPVLGNNVKVGANVTIMPGVRVGNDVTIGAWSMVYEDIPDGETWFGIPAKKYNTENKIHRTAIIHPSVKIGVGNIIGPYCVIGQHGFIRDAKDFKGTIEIGDNNIFGSHCTVMLGTEGVTEIGSGNLIMNYSNIGHNCEVGSNCEIGVAAILGGHSVIEDCVRLKMAVTVRNRKRVGAGSIIGMGAAVVSDIPPGEVHFGVPAKMKKPV